MTVSKWWGSHYQHPQGDGYINSGIAVRNVLTGQVRIESGTIRDAWVRGGLRSESYGLFAENSHVVVSDTLFTNIGVDGDDRYAAMRLYGGQTVVTVTNSTIQNINSDDWDTAGIYGEYNADVRVSHTTFQSNQGYPIRVDAPVIHDALDGTNVYNGNNPNRMLIAGGGIAESVTFYSGNGLDGYEFWNSQFVVSEGTTLTVQPGVTVIGRSNVGLNVQGTLWAVGTEDEHILFTSAENSGRNQWNGIVVDGGQLEMQYAAVRYAYTGVKVQGGGSAEIIASDVVTNTTGVHVTGSEVNIKLSSIYNNSDYGVRNDTTEPVDARYNWWGSAGGPTHPSNPGGTGDKVSDYVLFEPWLEQKGESLGILNQTSWDNTTLTYDQSTGTYTRHYPDGTIVHFNSDGTHDYTLDPVGNKIQYVYNTDGTLARVEFIPAGWSGEAPWKWTFTYGQATSSGKVGILSAARTVVVTDPAGRSTTLTLNEKGDLVQVTFPNGATRTFTYDSAHRMTHKQDELGNVTTYVYGDRGRVRRLELPPRPIYDPNTGKVQVARQIHYYTPSDVAYQVVNDMKPGNPVSPTQPLITSTQLVDKVSFGRGEYRAYTNRWGSPTQVTDSLNRTTRYDRNDQNRIVQFTAPSGYRIQYSYDEAGNPLSETHIGGTQKQVVSYTYEPRFNKLKTATDPEGNTFTFIYDYETGVGEAGKVVEIRYPAVKNENGETITPTVRFAYNQWGQIEVITDQLGTVTRFVYTQGTSDEAADGSNPLFLPGVTPVPGLLTKIIRDANGIAQTTVQKDFDAAGNPHTRIASFCCGAQGPEYRYDYDVWGLITSITNPLGIVTLYQYDAAGNLVRQILDYTADGTSGFNVTVEYTYDSAGNLLSTRLQDGSAVYQTSTYYDINQRPAVLVDALGNRSIYSYNEADELVSIRDAAGNETRATYNPDGQIETITDRRGTVTRWEYDAFGRMVKMIEDYGGLNLTTFYAYDTLGRLVSITDTRGVVTTREYDALSRLVKETIDPGGLNLSRSYRYDAAGNLRQETDERGVVTLYTYDALGRTTVITRDVNGLNKALRFAYDQYGNLKTFTDANGVVTYREYNALGQIVLERLDQGGLNIERRFEYDRLGNLSRITDPRGRIKLIEYNAFGLPVREVDDAGGIGAETRYTYDGALRLVAVTNANGQTTRYAYDALNRLTTELYPDGTSVHYTYDAEGNITSITNQAGETISFDYDAVGRRIRRTIPGSYQTYTYDDGDLLIEASNHSDQHSSVVRYSYDALGNPISYTQQIDGYSWQMLWAYDYARSIITQTYPSGLSIVRSLDTAGRLKSLTRTDGSTIASYTYDDPNGRYTLQYGNGLQTVYTYDHLYRITDIESTIAHYGYTYDAADNVTSIQFYHLSGTPKNVYQYDGMNRLIKATYGQTGTTVEYLLDKLDNRLQVVRNGTQETYLPNNGTQLTDPMNRYTQVGSISLAYDAKGNLLQDGTHSYTYDALNRLVGVSATGGGSASYVYDALDRRIAKIVGSDTTYFIYDDGEQVLEERDGSNQLLARYTYDEGIDHPFTMERGGKLYYYHLDALGNVTEVSDESGALVERYTYEAFGQVSIFDGSGNSLSASGIGNPYLFAARRYDPESGLYYFRARMYHPTLGRFMQMDPLGYEAGMNLYTYAMANPLKFCDPTGLFPCNNETIIDDWCAELAKLPYRVNLKRAATSTASSVLQAIEQAGRIKQQVESTRLGSHLMTRLFKSAHPTPERGKELETAISAIEAETWAFLEDYGKDIGRMWRDFAQVIRTQGPRWARYAGAAIGAMGVAIQYTGQFLSGAKSAFFRVLSAGMSGIRAGAGALGNFLRNPATLKAALLTTEFFVIFCGTNYLYWQKYWPWAWKAGGELGGYLYNQYRVAKYHMEKAWKQAGRSARLVTREIQRQGGASQAIGHQLQKIRKYGYYEWVKRGWRAYLQEVRSWW